MYCEFSAIYLNSSNYFFNVLVILNNKRTQEQMHNVCV